MFKIIFQITIAILVLCNLAEARNNNKSVTKLEKKLNKIEKKLKKLEKNISKNNSFHGDKNVEYSFGSTIYLDAASFHEDNTTLYDRTQIRKAEFYFKSKILDDYKVSFKVDTADNDLKIKAASLTYEMKKWFSVIVGLQKPPNSLENMTSSKSITFMERSLPVEAFETDRALGAAFNLHHDRLTLFAGAFGDGSSSTNEEEEFSLAARATMVPFKISESHYLHLGAHAVRTTSLEDVEFEVGPESGLTNEEFVDTGTISNTSKTFKYGAELLYQKDQFFFQYELLRTLVLKSVERENHIDPIELWGHQASFSFFLNGIGKEYDKEGGVIETTDIESSWGLFELAFRYSYIDLNDHREIAEGGTEAGVQENLTFGFNWYINDYVRLMINQIYVDVRHKVTETDNESPSITQMRLQVHF